MSERYSVHDPTVEFPIYTAQDLDTGADHLAPFAGLDPKMLGAYNSQGTALHATELLRYDRAAASMVNHHKTVNLILFGRACMLLDSPNVIDPDVWSGAPRGDRRRMARGEYGHHEDTSVMRYFYNDTGRSTVLLGLRSQHLVSYGPEIGIESKAPFEYQDIVGQLFRRKELDNGEVSIAELGRRMRMHGLFSPDKEGLDQRMKNFGQALHLETLLVLLGEAAGILSIGGRPRKEAIALYGKKEQLFAGDLSDTVAMARKFAATLNRCGVQANTNGSASTTAAAKRMLGFVNDIRHLQGAYTPIYTSLHYEIPPESWLLAAVEDIPRNVERPAPRPRPEAVAMAAGNIAVKKPEKEVADPRVVEVLAERVRTLGDEVRAGQVDWTLSRKTLEKQGLAGAVNALTGPSGCNDDEGPILSPLSRQEAQDLVAALHRLSDIGGGDIQAAVSVLANAGNAQTILEGRSRELRGEATSAAPGVSFEYPRVVLVRQIAGSILDQWSTYSRLLRAVWPPNRQSMVIDNIDRLVGRGINSSALRTQSQE